MQLSNALSATLLALTFAATACQDTSAIPPTNQAGAAINPAAPAIDPGNPAEVVTMEESKGGLAKGLAINPSPVPVSQQTPGEKAAGAKGGATKGQPGPGPTGVVQGPKLSPEHLAGTLPTFPEEEEGSPSIPNEMVKGDAKLKPIESPNQVQ